MEFELNDQKSESNKSKHGIDFREAALLWMDADLLEIEARTEDEPRFMAVGKLSGLYWSAIYTKRNDRIRLISVRRSRKKEIHLYEGFRTR
ncbi:MAG: BrnT family toxin [Bacteroidota bacterium]